MNIQKFKQYAFALALGVGFVISPGLSSLSSVQAQDWRRDRRWDRRDERLERRAERLERRLERAEMNRIRRLDRQRQLRYQAYNGNRLVGYYDRFGNFHAVGYYDRFGRFWRYQ
jgi:hypothetical protein